MHFIWHCSSESTKLTCQTGRQTDRHILQKWCVSASDIYLMVCTDVTCWSWFNVNQPTFHEDMRDKRFLNFHFQVLDLFDLKCGLPVTCIQGHICTKYEVSTVYWLRMRTQDRQSDRWDATHKNTCVLDNTYNREHCLSTRPTVSLSSHCVIVLSCLLSACSDAWQPWFKAAFLLRQNTGAHD